jgi:hypothetical protein
MLWEIDTELGRHKDSSIKRLISAAVGDVSNERRKLGEQGRDIRQDSINVVKSVKALAHVVDDIKSKQPLAPNWLQSIGIFIKLCINGLRRWRSDNVYDSAHKKARAAGVTYLSGDPIRNKAKIRDLFAERKNNEKMCKALQEARVCDEKGKLLPMEDGSIQQTLAETASYYRVAIERSALPEHEEKRLICRALIDAGAKHVMLSDEKVELEGQRAGLGTNSALVKTTEQAAGTFLTSISAKAAAHREAGEASRE